MADVPDLPDLLAEAESEAAGSAWEAASERLVMYATPSFVEAVDRVVKTMPMTRSVVLREAIGRGLPSLVNDVARLTALGFRPTAGRLADLDGAVLGPTSRSAPLPRWPWTSVPDRKPGPKVPKSGRRKPRGGKKGDGDGD